MKSILLMLVLFIGTIAAGETGQFRLKRNFFGELIKSLTRGRTQNNNNHQLRYGDMPPMYR